MESELKVEQCMNVEKWMKDGQWPRVREQIGSWTLKKNWKMNESWTVNESWKGNEFMTVEQWI